MADQENVVIKTEGVSKYFPGVQALKDLDFSVSRGEVHALCGENGAGKSTLMKIIVREYIEDEGSIFIEGQSIAELGIRGVQELGLSLIHQDLNLIPMLTVAQNICLGREPTTRFGTIDWKTMRLMAAGFLAEVTSDIDVEDRVENLSISEQQLVAIARALATSPRYLILDEPTARLDQKSSDTFFSFLERAKRKGLTVIYISHRLEEIYRICDRVTVLRDGRKIITSQINDTHADRTGETYAWKRDSPSRFLRNACPSVRSIFPSEGYTPRKKGKISVSISGLEKSWVLWGVSALERVRWHGPSSVRTPSNRGPSAFPAKK